GTQPALYRSHGTRAFNALPSGSRRVGGSDRRRHLLARASIIEGEEITMKLFLQKTALLVMLAALLSGAASCSKNSSMGKPNKIDYWTCTMHPSVREKGPVKCPICSMDLVPVMKESATPAGSSKSAPQHDHAAMLAGKPSDSSATSSPSHEFVVPVERQQQIGVRYAKVERKPLRHIIRAVGLIAPDKTRNWQFVSRVEGYVQKLYVTAPGELVEKDAPLLSIYSPDLLTTERELVELLRMRDEARSKEARETPERLIESAKRRLLLWNVTYEQITELQRTLEATYTITLLSPFRGVVQSVPAEQGKSVKVGDMLVEVADLSRVWVWADFYENELSMLQTGQRIVVTTKS